MDLSVYHTKLNIPQITAVYGLSSIAPDVSLVICMRARTRPRPQVPHMDLTDHTPPLERLRPSIDKALSPRPIHLGCVPCWS